MPYNLYLHRSFDIQLSPVAASIIDWAPTRYEGLVNSGVPPCLKAPTESRITLRDSDKVRPSFNGRQMGGEIRTEHRAANFGSQNITDDGNVFNWPRKDDDDELIGTDISSGNEQRRVKATNVTMLPRLGQRQLLLNSYAAVPLVSRGSFSLHAGLFAGLGIAGNVLPLTSSPRSSSSSSLLSLSFGWPFLTTSDVLQLEYIWGRMQWAGIFNLVCFSWPLTTLPMCEFIAMTPTMDWSLQTDKLLFSWSGFWRIFVRHSRRRRQDSLISLNSPAEPLTLIHNNNNNENNNNNIYDDFVNITENTSDKWVEGGTSSVAMRPAVYMTPTTRSSTRGITEVIVGGGGSGLTRRDDEQQEELCAVKRFEVEEQNAQVVDKKLPGDVDVIMTAKNEEIDVPHSFLGHSATNVHVDNTTHRDKYKWWRLEELRCGAGLAVKNDLASGVNVYCGCSGHFGRALTFSTHIDVLRRACCSITSNTATLDLAARLRINLITWHRTELDFGIGWRPLKHVPSLTCRLSRSMGRTFLGITIKDVLGGYNNLVYGRDVVKEGQEAQCNLHVDRTTQRTSENINVTKTSLIGWSISGFFNPYIHGLQRLYGTFVGPVSSSSSTFSSTVPPVENVTVNTPGLRQRISESLHTGLNYATALSRQAVFDITVGVAEERSHSRTLRCFLVFSAH